LETTAQNEADLTEYSCKQKKRLVRVSAARLGQATKGALFRCSEYRTDLPTESFGTKVNAQA
jgi:hypothetical protein